MPLLRLLWLVECIKDFMIRTAKAVRFFNIMNEGEFIIKLLGLDGLEVINFEQLPETDTMRIKAQMKRRPHICPNCGQETNKIHDYRSQIVKVDPINNNNVEIELNKRRYSCPSCNKRFFEEIPWLKRYQRHTSKT